MNPNSRNMKPQPSKTLRQQIIRGCRSSCDCSIRILHNSQTDLNEMEPTQILEKTRHFPSREKSFPPLRCQLLSEQKQKEARICESKLWPCGTSLVTRKVSHLLASRTSLWSGKFSRSCISQLYSFSLPYVKDRRTPPALIWVCTCRTHCDCNRKNRTFLISIFAIKLE